MIETQAIVLPDGSVGDARIVRSLDPDLDRQALLSLYRWKFKPALKDGAPVPFIVSIELSFALGKRRDQ